MSAESPELYFRRRARLLDERRARRQEVDYAARYLTDEELYDNVGHGWRALVLELHRKLLTLDPDYRLYVVKETRGWLDYRADVTSPEAVEVAELLRLETMAKAVWMCEVCGGEGLWRERPRPKTLCHACHVADRAAAEHRGELYAAVVLTYLLADDDAHPKPEEMIAWVEQAEA